MNNINMSDSVNPNNFGRVSDYSNEILRIVKNVKQLRNIKKGKSTNWEDAAEWHMKYSNLNGESVLALTITLSPTGCEWARKGGCTMCGEFEGSEKRENLINNPEFHIAQFASAIGKPEIWKTAHEEGKPISWLRINQEGNFTNPNEVNKKAQEKILRLATRINGIKRITIESRPQYLDQQTLEFLSEIFDGSGVELEIGMGIEAENEVVRNVCINKQGTNKVFVNTAKILKNYNILSLAYILLKPPFLTEQEAIDEAVAAAHFAAEVGFSRISFEPMSIHPYSLVDALTQTGDYKLPWLWSVVEVAKRCSDIAKIFGIGGIGYYPIPKKFSQNQCPDNEDVCGKNFADAIIEYNRSRDVRVFDSLSCNCKNVWENECRQADKSLKERIEDQLTHVESILLNYPIQNEREVSGMTIRNRRILATGSQ